ncbi:MAG TPA: class I SAM-dependent methyltransferase [Aquifex aeolicus]|uniref:Class I SAM-dependent methyltransferase n=1 Tax=Aquifex aeolicus TaxID=63363 RepID=A0A9D0YNE5_AQUAO|nr:class I SAM-dependent methyltransferase [Aquificales bacterium]HIP86791.1 class I SAM-dependent methyltransferase [Aquifex sp.]HIP97986.1 class I SAM-dependent methyltransferase [Aquifex aeolicus]HIQ26455.1 class I SAM-dependent methyltransferase [Aquifex aeolicus]
MAKITPFEKFTKDYENWFEKNFYLYQSELKVLKLLLEEIAFEKALEIGVGSGRFAKPLGVKFGVDPSPKMVKIAAKRGIKVVLGEAEHLPFKSETFDLVLMVTTICFVENLPQSIGETNRVLKKGGYFLVGFVDKNSLLGKLYEKKKNKSRFYKEAKFFSSEEVIKITEKNSQMVFLKAKQTIFGSENKLYPVLEGLGKGSFVGLLFKKY